jgi:hypothetical protein
MAKADDDKRLKQQLDANSAAIARMQMLLEASVRQQPQGQQQFEDDEDDFVPPQHQPNQQQQQQYQVADPNVMLMQAITAQAAKQAADKVTADQAAITQRQTSVKTRMERLLSDYPALKQEDSPLVARARDSYARIKQENPGLDEATRYELAVREAAGIVGARPLSAPLDTQDWTMPVNSASNPAVGKQNTKSRLTPEIVANARLMGINVDANTVDGKKNLAELSEYSARFNADVDESQYRYR